MRYVPGPRDAMMRFHELNWPKTAAKLRCFLHRGLLTVQTPHAACCQSHHGQVSDIFCMYE
eukprot:11191655-Lingulodinium_polyedra.AAC.1